MGVKYFYNFCFIIILLLLNKKYQIEVIMLHKKIWKGSPNFISATTSSQNQLHGKITEDRHPRCLPQQLLVYTHVLCPWYDAQGRLGQRLNETGADCLSRAWVNKQQGVNCIRRIVSDLIPPTVIFPTSDSHAHNTMRRRRSVYRSVLNSIVKFAWRMYVGWRENNKQQ